MTTRPFFDTLRDLRRGQLLEDCADKLQEVVAAVTDAGKAAKLLIEISVKPASKGQGAVIVADKVTTKLPQLPAGETVLFVSPENNLQANDPSQKQIEFRDASAPAAARGDLKTA